MKKDLKNSLKNLLILKNPPQPSLKKGGGNAAFTLAEVLITLAIVGVVAVLTIGNMVNNYRERQTVIRLKQTYNILTQAFLKMVEENGTLDTWQDDSQAFLRQEFIKHLKIVKSCDNDRSCFFGTSGLDAGSGVGHTSFTLMNGAVIGFGTRVTNSSEARIHCSYGTKNKSIFYGSCGRIVVDINGKKGPNKYSQDIFVFMLYTNRVLPLGSPLHTTSSWIEDFNRACADGKYEETCTAWVIYNENMDYLRCREKLGWNKAKSCKD